VSGDQRDPDGAAVRPLPVELRIGPVAHGGHCVARFEGRVVFVRHALPGELVRVRLDPGSPDDRFWRGDAVEVLEPSPHRVTPRCPLCGPGGCGGCDWQHADLHAQREGKALVVKEQLARLARLGPDDVRGLADLAVEAVPGDEDGLAWRTRMRFGVDGEGRPGLRRYRSHDLIPVPHCPLAHPDLDATGVAARPWRGASALDVIRASSGDRLVVVEPAATRGRVSPPPLADHAALALRTADGLHRLRGRTWVAEEVTATGPAGPVERTFRVTGTGFWQVHPGAASTLASAVLDAADLRPGQRAVDLYSGVGLLTACLAVGVGDTGRVLGIESDARAVADARRNLHDLPQAELVTGRVERVLPSLLGEAAWAGPDVVVLDPPRAGAGRAVMGTLLAAGPRAVVYVACDPAALARDVAVAGEAGYRLASVRAFDLFPMTHHVECMAVLVPRT
jgi:tRNA/tmRNA/rRNA uracil-C5-methylase (TrmA/RlmC/RlmD family)